jgi:hypothetical protein
VTVKKALQANYHCMGVTSSSVGSLWQGYFAEDAACSDAGPPVGAIVAGVIGGLVAVILLAWCVCKCQRHRRAGRDKSFDEAGSIKTVFLVLRTVMPCLHRPPSRWMLAQSCNCCKTMLRHTHDGHNVVAEELLYFISIQRNSGNTHQRSHQLLHQEVDTPVSYVIFRCIT